MRNSLPDVTILSVITAKNVAWELQQDRPVFLSLSTSRWNPFSTEISAHTIHDKSSLLLEYLGMNDLAAHRSRHINALCFIILTFIAARLPVVHISRTRLEHRRTSLHLTLGANKVYRTLLGLPSSCSDINSWMPVAKTLQMNPDHSLIPCAALFEQGIRLDAHQASHMQTYESNILYSLRFMIDQNIKGGQWVSLPKKTYLVEKQKKLTHCQLELRAHYSNVQSHAPEGAITLSI